MVHVGVDLHKRSAQLAVLMSDGELTQQRLENDPEQPEQFFAQVPRGARIAIEASGTWWWFVDLVELKKQHDEEREPNQLVLEGRLALQPRTRRADAPKRDGRPLGQRSYGIKWLRALATIQTERLRCSPRIARLVLGLVCP